VLKYAYLYKEKIQKLITMNVVTERCKFYQFGGYIRFETEIDDTCWLKEQFVSVDGIDNITGYLCAYIGRPINNVTQIAAMSFPECNKTVWREDKLEFFNLMLKKHNKINFSTLVGSNGEKMWDALVEKLNGRIVGIFKNDEMNTEGKIFDQKWYEILK
jgi:hypothetical protein